MYENTAQLWLYRNSGLRACDGLISRSLGCYRTSFRWHQKTTTLPGMEKLADTSKLQSQWHSFTFSKLYQCEKKICRKYFCKTNIKLCRLYNKKERGRRLMVCWYTVEVYLYDLRSALISDRAGPSQYWNWCRPLRRLLERLYRTTSWLVGQVT